MNLRLMDTDHISLIQRNGEEGKRIVARMSSVSREEIALSIVTFEEQTRGRLAEIARARSVSQQQLRYAELNKLLETYCATQILPFDDAAIAVFQDLWLQRTRIGTMDLKIAAIALANNATLLTRNAQDFSKVPNLRIEDWSF